MILREYLRQHKDIKSGINLFFDIETFQYNEKQGRKNPSRYKNHEYSVAVSYYEDINSPINIIKFATFGEFFKYLFKSLSGIKVTKINLFAHNGNKFDHHYLMRYLKETYPNAKYGSGYLRQAVESEGMITKKSLGKSEDYILEKRVKSKTNLEIDFRINGVTFNTVDTYPKCGALSLEKLGKALFRLKLIKEDELKQDYTYDAYNSDDDIDDPETRAKEIFAQLCDKELKYIDNDVIILAEFWRNYNVMFPMFDKTKITFSQNVFERYKTNPLANFQLTNKYKKALHIKYTDYAFNGINFYDYIKRFYKGGLNVYNDRYIGKVIQGNIKSYDLNSSYPNSMYNAKIPTYISETLTNGVYDLHDVDDDNYYYLLEVDTDTMNDLIGRINSDMIKKSLVKYYNNTHENYYINSNTLRLCAMFSDDFIKSIAYISLVKWECVYFGARDVIADCYFTKVQGKRDTKVIMNSPSDIVITDIKGNYKMTKSEIDTAKIVLNGIYGLPALRAYYNLFTYDQLNSVIDSHPNGFQNTERNLIFSTFVTSQSLINLLKPLKTVPPELIDDHFYYADTDSLWIDDDVSEYISNDIIDKYNLGYWDNEHNLDRLYLLNHKKYAYRENGEIFFRCGGIPQENFNTEMPFDEFIKTQFSKGVVKTGTRSYLTEGGTIAIYDAKIKLEQGSKYPTSYTRIKKFLLKEMIDMITIEIDDNDFDQTTDDVLYIETSLGSLGMGDLIPVTYDPDGFDVSQLIMYQSIIKNKIEEASE